jgi:hypothetical protein
MAKAGSPAGAPATAVEASIKMATASAARRPAAFRNWFIDLSFCFPGG